MARQARRSRSRASGSCRGSRSFYAGSAALFAVSAPACWALAQRLPFNGLELVWNPLQLAWLAGLFLLLSLPFFFAACCFGLAFMHARERIAVLYAADLIGAGLGAGIATGLLFLLPVETALRSRRHRRRSCRCAAVRTEARAPRVAGCWH